ncbi:hypothetical protein Poli38472_008306 [Pythium oligandrum]|uniref:HSF-type DNA-binding domain-containing protein n=1 Tax=Pythium oligandrum TaxID=41045 RepID=A0A8K1CLE2_PYTOL|nr:hypothetical protein Poli38472_008306 [Pythium oligandrum]|eukprot:TMW65664.1 hypothetical protein Poli38472_008306 [Pythium oligandrum]
MPSLDQLNPADRRFLDHLYLVLNEGLVASCLCWHPEDPYKFTWHSDGENELFEYIQTKRGRFNINRIDSFRKKLTKLNLLVVNDESVAQGDACEVYMSTDQLFYRKMHNIDLTAEGATSDEAASQDEPEVKVEDVVKKEPVYAVPSNQAEANEPGTPFDGHAMKMEPSLDAQAFAEQLDDLDQIVDGEYVPNQLLEAWFSDDQAREMSVALSAQSSTSNTLNAGGSYPGPFTASLSGFYPNASDDELEFMVSDLLNDGLVAPTNTSNDAQSTLPSREETTQSLGKSSSAITKSVVFADIPTAEAKLTALGQRRRSDDQQTEGDGSRHRAAPGDLYGEVDLSVPFADFNLSGSSLDGPDLPTFDGSLLPPLQLKPEGTAVSTYPMEEEEEEDEEDDESSNDDDDEFENIIQRMILPERGQAPSTASVAG